MTSTFPPCGPDCLKQRQLAALKTAMDSNPSNVQAKNDYYTALYGQDWLRDQKKTVAKESVEPKMTKYRAEYENLTAQLKSQGQLSSLAKSLKSDGGMPYLVQDYEEEKSKADTLNRLWKLSGQLEAEIDLVGIILYALIAALAIAVISLAVVKYRKHTAPSIVGGNRLSRK